MFPLKIALLAVCCTAAFLNAADKPLHLNVLAVGNSYTGNTDMFPKWVAGSGKGHTLTYERMMIGGATLDEHWQSVVMLDGGAPAKHPKTGSLSRPLVAALGAQNWDYVVFQQAFPHSANPRTYEPYLGNLLGLAKRYAPEATPLFYQTWVFREDNKLYRDPHTKLDREGFKKAVVEAGNAAAAKHKMGVIPAGEALFAAEADFPFVRDPNFDYENPPTKGVGPKGETSLYRGWCKWRDIMLEDNVHLGVAGRYIVGGIWYAVLYGEKAEGNAFVPEGLTPQAARLCQQIVDRIATGRQLPRPALKSDEKPPCDFSKQQAALDAIKAADRAKKNPAGMSKQEAKLIK